jgi:O-antigen/teichoic acid export membrane protein
MRNTVQSILKRGAIDAFISRVVGAGLLFLMHSVLARKLGADTYGVFSFVLSLCWMLASLVTLGWPTAIMRFTPQYRAEKKFGLLRGSLIRAHQIIFIASVLSAVILYFISLWFSASNKFSINIGYSAILLPVMAFVILRKRVFQGFGYVKSSIIPDEVILPLFVISGMWIFSVTSASGLISTYFCASTLILMGSIFWFLQCLPLKIRNASPEYKTGYWMKVALPMVFGGFSQIIMNRIDVFLLGFFLDMKFVGIYSLSSRIALLNVFVMTAVNTIGAPMLASAFYSGSHEKFRSIMSTTRKWCIFGSLPLFLLMVFFPKYILSFFGSEFSQGTLILKILAAGQFVNAATGLVGSALVMTGREWVFFRITALAAIANLIGNLLVIPLWGVLGAALVVALTVVGMNCAMLIMLSRATKSKVNK